MSANALLLWMSARRQGSWQQFRIAVRSETLKVLVVDSLPRWEYRYLRNALERDPGVESHCVLFHPSLGPGGGRNYLTAFPGTKEQLQRYDVIFLGDVGVGEGELKESDVALIRGLVEHFRAARARGEVDPREDAACEHWAVRLADRARRLPRAWQRPLPT